MLPLLQSPGVGHRLRPYRCPGCKALLSNRSSSQGIYVRLVGEDGKPLKGKPSSKALKPYLGSHGKRISGYSFNCPGCGVLVHVARKDIGNWVYLREPEKLTIYLSASTALREQVIARAVEVEALGAVVVSTWTQHFPPGADAGMGAIESYWAECAKRDDKELAAARLFIGFTEVPRGHNPRGGLHTELGLALKSCARVVLIGPRSQPFHYHEKVESYVNWEHFLPHLEGR